MARLEEKRRAIEAQKKRIEAIFAKHRQRLGQNALQRLRQDEEGASPTLPEDELSRGIWGNSGCFGSDLGKFRSDLGKFGEIWVRFGEIPGVLGLI
uniref:Uncharacterized protein n=1 Tax=Catharus ustulatus TaxID=91951 RepID=A0A8C3ULJ8_CATUS